jgi:asparagine synthase (glutamine-hydrolysing)
MFAGQSIADRYRRMMRIDAGGYLPDDILVKVDRATMAVSLESRSPFLDHRIAEFASTLPTSMLVHRGKGKRILRKLLERYVPKTMFDRPKMGFGVPVGNWLRRSLREWADDLLSERRLADSGFWNAAVVRSTWEDHAEGRVDASAKLWPILMFQCWQDAQRQQSRARRAA